MAGFFSNLFSKAPDIDYSPLRTDLHSHLIPGIDDGSQSMEESMKLIRGMHAIGFEKIITTPHIMKGGYDNTPDIINRGADLVRKQLEKENIPVTFEAAAEYYFDEYFESLLANDDLLTFADNYLLFELPTFNLPTNLGAVIFDINSKGYKPVLAHVERYTSMHGKDLEEYQSLKDKNVYIQVNIGSLLGFYSEQIRKVAFMLIENGLVDFLASDLHNERHLGYLKKGLKDKKLAKILSGYTFKNASL